MTGWAFTILYIARTFLNESTTKYALTIQVNRRTAGIETKPVGYVGH